MSNQDGSKKSELKSLLWILLLALAIRTFILEIFYVPTGSMKESILEGDYIFSTKYSYGYSIYSIPFSPNLFKGRILASEPTRGDVVIMQTPPRISNQRYIKRLIGLPGDKVEIINDIIYINDKQIKREAAGKITSEQGEKFYKFKETPPNGNSYYAYKSHAALGNKEMSNFGPYTVPEKHYFFLGDNRDYSGDSRYQLGMVPQRNLIAKGRFVLFSNSILLWDGNLPLFNQIKRVGSWVTSFRWSRSFQSMYEEA